MFGSRARTALAGLSRPCSRLAARLRAPALALLLAPPTLGGAAAQYVNCAQLQVQIAAASRPSPQAAAYERAARKQSAEIAKMQGYARTMGCDRQRFLFFGDPPPPQCGALNQRIAAMQGNLARLRASPDAGAGERRRMLAAQYDAYCRNRVAAAQPRNFFDQLFGGPNLREVPIGPPPETRDDEEWRQEDERGPRRGANAVCVRKCDGGFFPVSYSASSRNLDELADLCAALCPNAETELFTKREYAEIDEAVSIGGDAYSSLANAGKFRKKFDPSCSCKRPNQTWAQVLAQAEKLLTNKSNRDLIVTPQKAEELSRPKAIQAALSRRAKRTAQSEADEIRAAEQLEREGREQAAAASVANAGIAPGAATARRRYGLTDGARETIILADGEKKTIRVIGPKM